MRGKILRQMYAYFYGVWSSEGLPVRTKIHGYSALLNRGNTYPFILHDHPLFNAPLVELVHEVAAAKGSALTFLDVGAATGDTVFLIKERCPGSVKQFVCIEGDQEFYGLLSRNMSQFNDVKIVRTLLAREDKEIKSLVKHHKGSATCTGEETASAVSLDSVAAVKEARIDILKVDVDGYDGEVITGAQETLMRCQPAVIFEWHPQLIKNAGNDPFAAFELLAKCGYDRLVWYHNNGAFSHFSECAAGPDVKKLNEYLLETNSRADDHFDVVALPKSMKIDGIKMASLMYVRKCVNLKG
jgi:FkbM family methyltransferase